MNIDGFLDLLLHGKEIKDDIKSFKDMNKVTNGIKARARDLILQYPVLVSNTLSQETVSAVTRALEHDYANHMVLLISDQNLDGGPSTSDYLKGFHNNVLEPGNLPSSVLNKVNGEILNETNQNLFNEMSLNDLTVNSVKMKLFNEDTNQDSKGRSAEAIAKMNIKKADNYDKEFEAKMKKMELEINDKKTAQLVNSDVRKLNDMSPTFVKGNISVMLPGASVAVEKPIHFAVKAVAHLLDSDEIVLNLSNNLNDPSLLVKFIEWTTGEKRLFTDLIMQKDDMKRLATSKGKGAHWFRKLSLMANNAKMRKSWAHIASKMPWGKKAVQLINDRVPIPTMSLVISKSEVDQIRAKTGIDLLRKEGDIRALMDRFYLLTFMIVDDATEMVYLYDEVSKRYVTYSIKQLKGFAKDDLLTPEQAMKRSLMR